MRIYRAKPIAWTDSSVALLNEYGATLCTPDREATPLDLPEADGKEKSPPHPRLLPPTLPATKPPPKTQPGPSRTQARKVREWNEQQTTKEIPSCLFSL